MQRKILLQSLFAMALLFGCSPNEPAVATEPVPAPEATADRAGLTKVAILYPYEEGKTFDVDYYAEQHMPMVAGLFGDLLRDWAIDKGISGRTPEDTLPYVAVGYFYFDSVEDYRNAFGPNAEQILSDIPNYTDIQPVVQISEVIR